ncbi:MAG: glutathione S-transferase N-terminal domain-containing protein [Candidatus Aenigmarchaeota archaeon]|nr:glutathione S-transferase N-terminal domain-containing protein [Candidatus Aenigmarchaeota archaeon]
MKVKIYTTPTCPYCEMAKQYFKLKKIEYEEVDVSSDIEAAREMIEKSGQMGVPVIEIDDNIIIGFNKPAIERALKNI